MIVVDTHCHVGLNWFQPVEALLCEMQRNGVAKAVLTQFWGNYDNQYEIDCVRNYPGRFVATVLVDAKRTAATETLEKWAKKGAVGVRLGVDARSPGADPLAIWRKAAELGLVVSASGAQEKLASSDFRKLVEELSELKIVLEHLGVARGGANTDFSLFEKILSLAKYPNVYIKFGGFGEILPRPMPIRGSPFSAPPRELRMAYEAFGSEHMMWGSNFPPCSRLEGYTNALCLPMDKTPFFSEEDKEWAFGKTALSVWKMG